MAASSPAAAAYFQWYDVYINHRGPDVKENLARFLYLRLLSKGLRAFLYKPEMQQGYNIRCQIKEAVRTASVHVAIFSPTYAESDWCLNELLLMLESKGPNIPLFYGVTPAEVQLTRGSYGQALRNLAEKKTHQEKPRYDSDTLENWRNALSSVADNRGFELEACNGEELELELLNKVVERLPKMVKKPDLHVAKYRTGLDEK